MQLSLFTTFIGHWCWLHSSKHFPGHGWPHFKCRLHGFEQISWETSSEQKQKVLWYPQLISFSTLTTQLKLSHCSPHLWEHWWPHERKRSQGASQNTSSVLLEHLISLSWPQGNFFHTLVVHISRFISPLTPQQIIRLWCPQSSNISISSWHLCSSGFLWQGRAVSCPHANFLETLTVQTSFGKPPDIVEHRADFLCPHGSSSSTFLRQMQFSGFLKHGRLIVWPQRNLFSILSLHKTCSIPVFLTWHSANALCPHARCNFTFSLQTIFSGFLWQGKLTAWLHDSILVTGSLHGLASQFL